MFGKHSWYLIHLLGGAIQSSETDRIQIVMKILIRNHYFQICIKVRALKHIFNKLQTFLQLTFIKTVIKQ